MSAYLCSPDHLAAIARAAATLDARIDAERAFDLLLEENMKSISARYPDASRISDWYDDGEAAFVWERIEESTHTASELRDLVASYQYQSCEHEAWPESAAKKLTDLLLIVLAPRVKAEEAAAWQKVASRREALQKLPALHGKETAVEIRKLLKAHFPATKFSVRSDYNSVHVRWTDGPTAQLVEALIGCFKAGRFDGMTDCYEYDSDSVVTIDGQAFRPRCQYIFTNRRTSATMARKAAAQVATYYGVPAPEVLDRGEFWAVGSDAYLKAAGEYWSTLIHQASCDATRFARHD